jgi:hypothetical protein
MNELYRRTAHRPARYLRGSIRTRSIPPRQVLAPNSNRRRTLDHLHIHRLLPPGAQPGQLPNAQLRPRRRRDCPYLRPRILGYERSPVVRGAHQADRRCAPALYSMFVLNADDKRSARADEPEEMAIGDAEPVVMSEKAEFSEVSSDS